MKDGEIYLVAQKNLEGNLDFSFSFYRKLLRLALRLSYLDFLRKKVAPACATLFPILFYQILDKWKQNC